MGATTVMIPLVRFEKIVNRINELRLLKREARKLRKQVDKHQAERVAWMEQNQKLHVEIASIKGIYAPYPAPLQKACVQCGDVKLLLRSDGGETT